MTGYPIGILALQGDFALHAAALDRQGEAYLYVRRPEELAACRGLIIPGGESTTMTRLLDIVGLRQPILDFAAAGKPILGTCAGLIMLAARVDEDEKRHGVKPLGLLDVLVQRNNYGRQVDSFVDEVAVAGRSGTVPGVFIRAPRILEVGPGVEVVATWRGETVGVRSGNVTGLAFHPEAGESEAWIS
ncbi:MAG: pyridoxal 5'-phosphate synthase glutaminase subunit PdxT [bacterium]|nr:pyridoxal 5'-phosphate synthase glutaminase subunit PdxT [bacterium]